MDRPRTATALFLISTTRICSILGEYFLDPSSGRCTQVFDSPHSWENAVKVCERQGAELGKITSQDDQHFYNALLKDDKRSFWTQMNDKDKESTFTFLDGGVIRYKNWMKDQPDCHLHPSADCVRVLWFESWSKQMWLDSARWDDFQCDKELPFVCEKPANSSCILLTTKTTNGPITDSITTTTVTTNPGTFTATTGATTITPDSRETSTASSTKTTTTPDVSIANTKATTTMIYHDEASNTITTEMTASRSQVTAEGGVNADTGHADPSTTGTPAPEAVTDKMTTGSAASSGNDPVQLPITEEVSGAVTLNAKEASAVQVHEGVASIPRQYLTYIVAGSTFLSVPLLIIGIILCRYCCLFVGARRKVEDDKDEEEYRMKSFKTSQ